MRVRKLLVGWSVDGRWCPTAKIREHEIDAAWRRRRGETLDDAMSDARVAVALGRTLHAMHVIGVDEVEPFAERLLNELRRHEGAAGESV